MSVEEKSGDETGKEGIAAVTGPADRSRGHIKTYVLAAAGAGLIPVPGVDLAGIAAVQCRLVQLIAREYGVPFKENAIKTIVASLLGSAGAARLFAAPAYSLLKVIPLVGQTLSGAALSGIAAAGTYAIGNVFVQHFETGGTLLDFDSRKIGARYARMFEEGKLKVSDYLKDKTPAELEEASAAAGDHSPSY
jgi:uncharacterized protein (DUF697 family)